MRLKETKRWNDLSNAKFQLKRRRSFRGAVETAWVRYALERMRHTLRNGSFPFPDRFYPFSYCEHSYRCHVNEMTGEVTRQPVFVSERETRGASKYMRKLGWDKRATHERKRGRKSDPKGS